MVVEELRGKIDASTLPLAVVVLPLIAASLAGVGYEHSRNVWLVCLAIILCLGLVELRRCRGAGISVRPSLEQFWELAILGGLLVISAAVAALQTVYSRWYVPLANLAFLFSQGFGTAIFVVARGLRDPAALQRLGRALEIAGILVCLSVVVAHMAYMMFFWRFGEVIHPGFGVRSFGPLGDSVAWIIAPYLGVWVLRGAKMRSCLSGAAIAMTGSLGPLFALGLGAFVLLALDTLQHSKDRLLFVWKKRAFVSLWVILGMIAATIPLPDFHPCRSPPCQHKRDAGALTMANRLIQSGPVPEVSVPTVDMSRAVQDRLSNVWVSFDLLKRNWWLGAGYGATEWRFREVSWQVHVPKELALQYEEGKRFFYAINVWIQLLISGGFLAVALALWLWQRIVLETYRRMNKRAADRAETLRPFVWVLLGGCMLSADWLLPFSPVFQLIAIAVGESILLAKIDYDRSVSNMTAVA
jgi:hypothetical protein